MDARWEVSLKSKMDFSHVKDVAANVTEEEDVEWKKAAVSVAAYQSSGNQSLLIGRPTPRHHG